MVAEEAPRQAEEAQGADAGPDRLYRENGYLIVEDAGVASQLEALRRITYDFIERSREVSESDAIYDLDEGHSAPQPRLTRIKLPHKQHPLYWEVLTTARMTDNLKPLLGPDIAPYEQAQR